MSAVKQKHKLAFLVIDLFCGAGGTSTGFSRAKIDGKFVAKVIACVNHDPVAIESHYYNHRSTLHFTEDIRLVNLDALGAYVEYMKQKYPGVPVVLWASLECTNFSKAKGGQPREADSRTLAEHLYRYIEVLQPDYVWIENVIEFKSWGPLDNNGKPISKHAGRDFLIWKAYMQNKFGYNYSERVMNAADYGAYTSRVRFFCQFAKIDGDYPIVWPEPTHTQKPVEGGMFGSLLKWKPVKEVLDFSDEGRSIFGRKKDLSPKTYERVLAGCRKYIKKGEGNFIQKHFSGRPAGKVTSTEVPAGTILTSANQSLVQTFGIKYLSNNAKTGVNSGFNTSDPCPTVTTQNRLGIVQASFMTSYYGGSNCTAPIDGPAATLTTKDRITLVTTHHIDKHFSSGPHNHSSVENPAGTILTSGNHFSLVTTHHLDKQYSGDENHQSIEAPAGTILTNDKHNLVSHTRWVMKTGFDPTAGVSVESPCPTLLASRKHHYLVNPQFGNTGNSIEKPCPTLIASLGKRPLSMVTMSDEVPAECSHLGIDENGQLHIIVYDTDCEAMVEIKKFMAEYGIVDIKMRMLKVDELLLIQGFPKNYYLAGTKSDQKKFIGNSVCPDLVQKKAEASALAIYRLYKKRQHELENYFM